MRRVSKDSSPSQAYRAVGPYLSLGIELVVAILLFFFAGWWLDVYWDTLPVLTLAGAFLGMIAGFYHFLKGVFRLQKRSEEAGSDAQDGDPNA